MNHYITVGKYPKHAIVLCQIISIKARKINIHKIRCFTPQHRARKEKRPENAMFILFGEQQVKEFKFEWAR
jgi:hypothetical protein